MLYKAYMDAPELNEQPAPYAEDLDAAIPADWVAEFEVDLPQSRAANEPVLRLRRIGSLV